MIYVIIFANKKQRCDTHTVYYTAVFVICKYDFLDNPVIFCLFCAFFCTVSKKYPVFRRFAVKDLPNRLAKKDALCYYYKVEFLSHPKRSRSALRWNISSRSSSVKGSARTKRTKSPGSPQGQSVAKRIRFAPWARINSITTSAPVPPDGADPAPGRPAARRGRSPP